MLFRRVVPENMGHLAYFAIGTFAALDLHADVEL